MSDDLRDDDPDVLVHLLARTLRDERFAVRARPGHFARLHAEVAERTRRRAQHRRVALAAAAVVVLGVGAAVTAGLSPELLGHDRRAVARPAERLPELANAPVGLSGTRLALPGEGVAVAAAPDGVTWVLSRTSGGGAVLQRWDVAAGRVTGEVTPPGGAPGGVTADGTRSVWAWTSTPGEPAVLTEYDARTLAVLRTVSRLATVTSAVADGGSLWYSTLSSVYRAGPGSGRRRSSRRR